MCYNSSQITKYKRKGVKNAHKNSEFPAGGEDSDRRKHLHNDRDSGDYPGYPPAENTDSKPYAHKGGDRNPAYKAYRQHSASGGGGAYTYRQPRIEEHLCRASFVILQDLCRGEEPALRRNDYNRRTGGAS